MPESKASQASRDRTYISRDEFEVFERNVDRSFGNLSEAMASITAKIDRLNSADYKTLGMVVSLMITIGVLAMSPFLRDLSRLEARQDKISNQITLGTGDRWTEDDERAQQTHELSETRRLEALIKTSVASLDEVLQREMRLLDDALQREMRTLLDAPLERLTDVEEDLIYWRQLLDERGRWMADTDTSRAAAASALSAKLEEIERTVREISAEQRRRTTKVYSTDE